MEFKFKFIERNLAIEKITVHTPSVLRTSPPPKGGECGVTISMSQQLSRGDANCNAAFSPSRRGRCPKDRGGVGQWATILAALLIFAIPAYAAPHPSLPSPVLPDGLGINIHSTDFLPGEMPLFAATGATWTRMDFGWGKTEKARGVYDWSEFERLLRQLEARRIRPIFILGYGNKLYSPVSPATPESRAAYARWAAAAVTHFRGRGVLWELWNEPNGFWTPTPNAADYTLMAVQAARAIKAAAPGEALIGPTTATFAWDFIETTFKGGLLDYLDAVSIHPYRNTPPETAAPDYDRLRALIAQYAPMGKEIPILCGEWGYTAQSRERSEIVQARYLTRQWLVNIASGARLSMWYDWRDDGDNPDEREHRFGIVRHQYRPNGATAFDPKPAYFAAQTLTRELNGLYFRKRLSGASEDDWILQFGRGDKTVLAVWTADAEATKPGAQSQRFTNLPPGKWRAISHGGERLPDIEGQVALTGAPLFLTPLP